MKIVRFTITFSLLIALIVLRLISRDQNAFWIDEIEEISHLISVRHLIIEYLPTIPGALPGHYLLSLAMNYISPGNKFILAIPGLIANILVFLLLPYTISLLKLVKEKDVFLVGTIARLGFVLDPRLTYQSIEIRPYAMLPLLWILSVIACSSLININSIHGNKMAYTIRMILLPIFITLIFTWHFYGFIMVITIYFFMLSKQNGKILKKLRTPSIYPIIVSTLIAIPVWKYFTKGLVHYSHNTFEFLSIFSNTTNLTYSMIFLVVLLFFCFIARKYLFEVKEILLYLVITPIIVIFILDLAQPYFFLYRQFAWVSIPFFIAVGVLVSKLLIRKKSNGNKNSFNTNSSI